MIQVPSVIRSLFFAVILNIGRTAVACDGPVEPVANGIGVTAVEQVLRFILDGVDQPQLDVDCTSKGVEVTVDPDNPLTMSFFSDLLQTGYFETPDFNDCLNNNWGPFPGNSYGQYGQPGSVDFTLAPAQLQELVALTDQFGFVYFVLELVPCDLDALYLIAMSFQLPQPPPVVSVTKRCLSGDEVFIGQPVRFEIEVTHDSGTTAENLVLMDTLPIEFDLNYLFVASDIDGAQCLPLAGRTLTCHLGDLAPGSSGKVWITTRTLQNGVITNNAQVTSTNALVNLGQASCGFEILDLNVMNCPEVTLLEPQNSLRCSLNMQPTRLDAIASGGTAPYTYLWLPPIDGGVNNHILVTPDQSSVYTVIVTDFHGCQVSKEVAVLVVTGQQAMALWHSSGPEFLPDVNRDGEINILDVINFRDGCN